LIKKKSIKIELKFNVWNNYFETLRFEIKYIVKTFNFLGIILVRSEVRTGPLYETRKEVPVTVSLSVKPLFLLLFVYLKVFNNISVIP
jgi:hypothetical protein